MFWATTFAIALLRERDKEWTLKRIQLRERYVDIKREREIFSGSKLNVDI